MASECGQSTTGGLLLAGKVKEKMYIIMQKAHLVTGKLQYRTHYILRFPILSETKKKRIWLELSELRALSDV